MNFTNKNLFSSNSNQIKPFGSLSQNTVTSSFSQNTTIPSFSQNTTIPSFNQNTNLSSIFNTNNSSNKNNSSSLNIFNNNLNKNNVDYKKISNDFCNIYYKTISNSINSTSHFFDENCKFTFLGEECVGFNNYLIKLQNKSINKLIYNINFCDSQCIGSKSVLINTTGKVSTNGINYFNYSELFILVKKNNNYFIKNNIFRLVE